MLENDKTVNLDTSSRTTLSPANMLQSMKYAAVQKLFENRRLENELHNYWDPRSFFHSTQVV